MNYIDIKIHPGVMELEVEVEFEHDPYEPQTFDSPGCAEEVRVYAIKHNGIDIYNYLAENEIEGIEERILKKDF